MLSTINKTLCLSFSPSAVQPTHKAPEPQLCAAGQTWSWGGRATAALKTQQAGSPEMQHWAEGHRYTYTEPPAIWITAIQREQGKETLSELVPSHLLCINNLSRNSGFFISWKKMSQVHIKIRTDNFFFFQCNIHNLLGSYEACTNHYIVSCRGVVRHRLCTCYVLLDRFLHLIGPLSCFCTSLILSHQHNVNY